MVNASDNAVTSLLITEGTEPAAPSSGRQKLWIDSTTHVLMYEPSSGAESAVGFPLGVWTTYTPTMTGGGSFDLGSSTLAGRYKLLDSKTVQISITLSITTGGSWNAGSTNWTFALPAGMTTAARLQVGTAHVLDSGTAHFAGICKATGSDTKIAETELGDDSGTRILDNNSPVTWATGDQVNLMITLEIV